MHPNYHESYKKTSKHFYLNLDQTLGSSPINRMSILCNEVETGCDSTVQFRSITGDCNHLDQAFLGAFGSIFSREIEVGPYNPRTDITIIDKGKLFVSIATFLSSLSCKKSWKVLLSPELIA